MRHECNQHIMFIFRFDSIQLLYYTIFLLLLRGHCSFHKTYITDIFNSTVIYLHRFSLIDNFGFMYMYTDIPMLINLFLQCCTSFSLKYLTSFFFRGRSWRMDSSLNKLLRCKDDGYVTDTLFPPLAMRAGAQKVFCSKILSGSELEILL